MSLLASDTAPLWVSTSIFAFFATIILLGALGVAFLKHIVYSAFALLSTFIGIVGLFAAMSADFLAVVQLMIYVGGILVLILFAVMLTNCATIKPLTSNPATHKLRNLSIVSILGSLLLIGILKQPWPVKTLNTYSPTAKNIGKALLGPYLLPFELTGFILLVALIAACMLARKEIKPSTDAGEPLQPSRTTPELKTKLNLKSLSS